MLIKHPKASVLILLIYALYIIVDYHQPVLFLVRGAPPRLWPYQVIRKILKKTALRVIGDVILAVTVVIFR